MKKSILINYLNIILKLINLRAHKNPVRISQAELGMITGYSQQSISRILKELKNNNYIEYKNDTIQVTELAVQELLNLTNFIQECIKQKNEIIIKGRVFTGFGDGKRYLSMDFYKNAVMQISGYIPYPGTLNLKIDEDYLTNAKLVRQLTTYYVKGKKENNRELGGFYLLPCQIVKYSDDENNSMKSVAGYIIIPEKTHYNLSVIELISKNYLRKKLNLIDGDKVIVRLTV
ncbi:MAG: DUF120 domain-containing protein [Candidatus Micrarchaeota archaeon]|nr:DUF120 domain-containing protein [Candidatus Micrarchaeota archaeon]